MSDLVAGDQIESIVGAKRHRKVHLGRAVSAEQTVYILHSQTCLDSGVDLRDCPYSVALDRGIDVAGRWAEFEDETVLLGIWQNRLIPVTRNLGNVERAEAGESRG